ncbi:MAG: phosphotyrosine protein phosphatase [Candidatus Methylumidiphilus alinenensis]|uniref:protein-tyrosine-phosphatase n=1 Tax=Candidatus Methylumidiphilus alinenensis TaxID=2202197 RepID=A0A2W4SFZ2_9GAMM|nr:MAG: phosphotyrosine protein phosphatase [Candidatus Methylumidiphilus alinenensis]
MNKQSVLFVCMGNICRSPTAEGVFRKLLQDEGVEDWFEVDSAGTHAYHIGSPPDERAQKAALARGIDLSKLRARKVDSDDFESFDHILVMDQENYDTLIYACPRIHSHKVKLFLEYAPSLKIKEVPDPYYGGSKGFENVLFLIEQASVGFLKSVRDSVFNIRYSVFNIE